MQATELCMEALKLATSQKATKPEKAEIRARCKFLLDEAERIKQIPVWTSAKKKSDLVDSFANIDLRPVSTHRPDLRATVSSATSSDAASSSHAPPFVSKSPNIESQVITPTLALQPPKPKPARLREPVSARVLPVAEKVLLLHASKLNGFKFPPWTGPPKPEEFDLDGGEPFK